MKFQISDEEYLTLKHENPEGFMFLQTLMQGEGDYVDTLDHKKLASECRLGYFEVGDLFSPGQIKSYETPTEKEGYGMKTIGMYLSRKMPFKVKVTPEQSEDIQEMCFREGIYWRDGTREVLEEYYPYLILSNWTGKLSITYGECGDRFNERQAQEIVL